MESMHYIGLDIHKKMTAFCIKSKEGAIVEHGIVAANRQDLLEWVQTLPRPWMVAMEATLFTGWVYDLLKPYAAATKVAHPQMLKAITAAKKKNDAADAEKIADLLRVDLIPECYMAPLELRELRRILRYRNHIIRMVVKEKNKISGLLMEVGATYAKKRLHGKRYFHQLLETIEDVPESVINMLQLSRSNLELFMVVQKKLIRALKANPLICDRVKRLMTIPGIGEVTALT